MGPSGSCWLFSCSNSSFGTSCSVLGEGMGIDLDFLQIFSDLKESKSSRRMPNMSNMAGKPIHFLFFFFFTTLVFFFFFQFSTSHPKEGDGRGRGREEGKRAEGMLFKREKE